MHQQPDFVAAIRNDLSDWRQWVGRAVVMAYAVAAGLAVVAFTWLSQHALDGFDSLRTWQPLLPLVWTPAWTVASAWITLRFVPGAAGSGIPQVMAALSPNVPVEHRSLFVSLRLSLAKALLTAGACSAAWRSAARDLRCRSPQASCSMPSAGCHGAPPSTTMACSWRPAPQASPPLSMRRLPV